MDSTTASTGGWDGHVNGHVAMVTSRWRAYVPQHTSCNHTEYQTITILHNQVKHTRLLEQIQ